MLVAFGSEKVSAQAARAAREGESKGVHEQILLFPVRTNRTWWTEYARAVPSSIAWLRPITFAGYEGSFPAPLVLVHTGTDPNGSTLRFRSAVSELSTFVGGPLV
jgi:hypothetical protein